MATENPLLLARGGKTSGLSPPRGARPGREAPPPAPAGGRDLNNLGSELQALNIHQQMLFDPSVSPDDKRLESYFPAFTRRIDDELSLPSATAAAAKPAPATPSPGAGPKLLSSARQKEDLDRFFGEIGKPIDLSASAPGDISFSGRRMLGADSSSSPAGEDRDGRSRFRIDVRQPARPVGYSEVVERIRRDQDRQERAAVRFAAASAAAAAAAAAIGADADKIECKVTVEEQALPVAVSDERRGEREATASSIPPAAAASTRVSSAVEEPAAEWGAGGDTLVLPEASGGPRRGRKLGTEKVDAENGTARVDVADPVVYSRSRWVDERRGEGGAPPAQFPFPRGLTEMQERMEEEWIDRERRLRAEHKRELEKALAHETEKLSREYSRRLVFELQEQEKELLSQMHERQRQALAEIRCISESKTDAQEETQRLQRAVSTKEQHLQKVTQDLRLLQSEREALLAKVQTLETENANLHAALTPLEKQACTHRAKEEDLQLRLDRVTATNDRLQLQLQHEQQLAANFAQKRRGLEREIEVSEEKRATAEREWKRVAAELREVQERQAGLHAANAHLQNELDNAIRHGKNLEQKIGADKNREEERQQLSQRVERLQEEKKDIERRDADEITSLRNRLKHLETIEWQYRTLRQDYESQKIEVEHLRDENAILLAELRHQNKEGHTTRLDQQALHNDLIVLKQENVDLRKEVNRLIKERNSAATGALPPYTPTRPTTLSTTPSPENPLVTRSYGPESPAPLGAAARIGTAADPSLNENNAAVCSSLTGPMNRRCFTSDGRVRCLTEPSIVQPQHAGALDAPGSLVPYGALRCSTTNNPTGRCTQPSPFVSDATNPLEHVHYPSVASRLGLTGDHPSYMYNGADSKTPVAWAGGLEERATRGNARHLERVQTPEQVASLERQLLLLSTERRRIESELSRIPAARGRTVKERQQMQQLEQRLAEVDTTMHRMKQSLFQARRKK